MHINTHLCPLASFILLAGALAVAADESPQLIGRLEAAVRGDQ